MSENGLQTGPELIAKIRENPASVPPITYDYGVVLASDVESFKKATTSSHCFGIPPTFVTRCRWAEFEWLRRGHVDMKKLLHTEQEYTFLSPLKVGDRITISTGVESWREKRGIAFAALVSEIRTKDEVKVRVLTTFVVRGGAT